MWISLCVLFGGASAVSWAQSTQGNSATPEDEGQSEAGAGGPAKSTRTPTEQGVVHFEIDPETSAINLNLGKHLTLSPGGLIQFRATQNYRQDSQDDEYVTSAFTVPRVRLWLNLRATRWVRAFIRFGALTNGRVEAEYAWIDLVWNRLSLRGGRLQLPLFFEDNYMPHFVTAIDYSSTNHVFSQGASQGAMLSYAWKRVQLHAAITDGLRTGFTEVASPEVADYAVTGRIWGLLIGEDWSSSRNLSAPHGTTPGLRVGAACHYQHYSESSERQASNLLYGTTDIVFRMNRMAASVGAVVVWNEAPTAGQSRVDWGLVSYLSGFALTWLEPWVRFDVALAQDAPPLDDPSAPNRTDFHTLAGGLNAYLFPGSNGLRLQFDFQYMFDRQDTSIVSIYKAGGVLPSAEPQWALRTQLTAAF